MKTKTSSYGYPVPGVQIAGTKQSNVSRKTQRKHYLNAGVRILIRGENLDIYIQILF